MKRKPEDPSEMTVIMPSPDTDATAIQPRVPAVVLRPPARRPQAVPPARMQGAVANPNPRLPADGVPAKARRTPVPRPPRPVDTQDLWRPAPSPTARTTGAKPLPAEQTDIAIVTHQIAAHACRADMAANFTEWQTESHHVLAETHHDLLSAFHQIFNDAAAPLIADRTRNLAHAMIAPPGDPRRMSVADVRNRLQAVH